MANKKQKEQGRELVVKANELVQLSQTKMSLAEMRAFAYIVSHLDFSQEYTGHEVAVTFRKAEFCRAVGISSSNGGNNKYLIETLKKLHKTVITIEYEEGKIKRNFNILKMTEINTTDENNETVTVLINDTILPLLVGLKKNFTSYQIGNVLSLNSKYSFRLYEYLKSYRGSTTASLDKLRELFSVNHKTSAELIRKTIEPAVKEINEKTDLFVQYDKIKKDSRTTVAIRFVITDKAIADDDEEEVVFYGVPQSKTAPVMEQLALDI